MKVQSEVSAEKLRGGFYSPPGLVTACLARIDALLPGSGGLRILEPTVGDGAFIRGLAQASIRGRVDFVEAVELLPSEAACAQAALEQFGADGHVYAESFLSWPRRRHDEFDVAIGNPPFVRFQFLSDEDKAALPMIGEQIGVSLRGVSNLWIPVLLLALASLRRGGAFAFIVPTELLTGISANEVRKWLCDETTGLEAQLFPPGSFPGVLQEVIVLSGRRERSTSPSLTLVEFHSDGTAERWHHRLDRTKTTWTRYLLPPNELEAFDVATDSEHVSRLATIARFEVAAVTGANDFFSVSSDVITSYGLEPWARPLLPRARWAPGLRYTIADHEVAAEAGARVALLDFSAELPDPLGVDGPRRYVESGELASLHRRYKTRIRDPWYRVPHIRAGRLMLSKRSHRFPRLILNDAGVVTTDTLYRGWMRPAYEGREEDLAAVFHNSLTLLSAEVEGRSFGGGVLELVPSEIARLLVPLVPGAGVALEDLSRVPFGSDGEVTDQLIDRTDEVLLRHARLDSDVLLHVRSARDRLQSRRLDRTNGADNRQQNGAHA